MEPIKILLVDDSKSARYALRLQLQRCGMLVDTVESAEAALERVRETPPDAILMDHTMPGMNGFEALEILKSSLDTARIPVVMCTSHDDPAFSAQALRRGALGVLTKAVAAERLPTVLDQIRATLAQATLPEAQPPIETVPEAAPPVAIGHDREQIQSLVEERLGLLLPARLAEVVDPLVARINAQLRQVIAEQVEMAIDALPSPAPAPGLASAPSPQFPPAVTTADLNRLRDETIPAVVRRHMDTELDRILKLMQQCVQEGQAPKEDPEAMQRLLHSVEATVATQATQIARREVEDAMNASQTKALVDDLVALRRGLRWSYALGALALLLALGAAGLLLLRG